jgi:hypothetical protein
MQATFLTAELAQTITADRLEEAERARRARAGWRRVPDPYDAVVVRRARPGDGDALHRLAELDGRGLPAGPALVAEAGGAILAARSLVDGSAVADPFRPTAPLVELLALRSVHLRTAEDGPVRAPRRLLRALRVPARAG